MAMFMGERASALVEDDVGIREREEGSVVSVSVSLPEDASSSQLSATGADLVLDLVVCGGLGESLSFERVFATSAHLLELGRGWERGVSRAYQLPMV